MKKVSLQGPKDFSGVSEGRTNSKNIILQHHDARTPTTIRPTTAETLSTTKGPGKHWRGQMQWCQEQYRSNNRRRNTCNGIGASNSMDKGKSVVISNSRVTINSKDAMAIAGRPANGDVESIYLNFLTWVKDPAQEKRIPSRKTSRFPRENNIQWARKVYAAAVEK
jgi:hypothetical protein